MVDAPTEPDRKDPWLDTIVYPELRSEIQRSGSYGDRDNLVRAAFVLLERRIRESAGLASHYYGKELIDAAFHPETGRLQPVSAVGAERAGLHYLLLGLVLYYRNPIAHRPMYYSEQSARQVLSLIDHALELVRLATERAVDLRGFVSPHEGQILRRRDYRLDIDGDGDEEVVVMVEFGPSLDGGKLVRHVAPVVLKQGAGSYTRIPADSMEGLSIYGSQSVELRHVTDLQRPDLIVAWAWGETMELFLTLRYDNGRYVLVERENAPDAQEPYDGPSKRGFTIHGAYKDLAFADIDGDGLDEIVQTLRFSEEELVAMGYPEKAERREERLAVCRVWKWDAQKHLLGQVDERLIIEDYSRYS